MLLENNPYPHDIRVRREAEALTAAGHRVTVAAPRRGDEPWAEEIAGVRVRRFPLAEGSGVAGLLFEYAVAHVALFAIALWELVAGCDVIHAHNPPDTLFPAGLLARALGRRFVYDHHDLTPELFEDKFGDARLRGVLERAQRASARAADAVVVTNQSQAKAVATAWPRGRERIAVVRNGPTSDSIVAEPATRTGDLSDPRIVYVGTLEQQDGVLDLPALLDAVDAALPDGAAASLTVVGEGTVRARLERAFSPAQRERVTMTGRVPHERVAELLGESDVAVDVAPCGELNHRSTMVKIAEYLAAGLPTVSYRLRETEVTGGDAVLFADCGDVGGLAGQVSRVASDARLRGDLARRAVERARELTWERSAATLVSVYEGLG